MGRRMIKNNKSTTTAALNKALWVKWSIYCKENDLNATDYVEAILWRWLKGAK